MTQANASFVAEAMGPDLGARVAAPGALATTAVLAAMAAVVTDAGMLNVALPTLAAVLDVPAARVMWLVNAYQAGVVMFLLPCGALGERYGHRRVFAMGLTWFATCGIASALAPSLHWLVVTKLLQGLGAAAVMSLGVALLRLAVPREALPKAIGWNAMTVAVTAAAAPGIGAIVLAQAPWRLMFLASLPAVAVSLAASRALPAGPRNGAPLDYPSIAMNAAFFALLVATAKFAVGGLALPAALIGCAALVGYVLVRREWPKPQPLVPIDLLRAEPFRLAVIASVFCFTGQAAGLIALPFLLQHDLHLSLLATGFYLTAWPVGAAATALAASRLARRVSGATLCATGAGLLATCLGALACWPSGAPDAALVPLIAMCGAGFGLFQTPNNLSMFLSAPSHRSGAAGGMQGTARLTGQTCGVLAVTLVFALGPSAAATSIAFALGAACALGASMTSVYRRLA